MWHVVAFMQCGCPSDPFLLILDFGEQESVADPGFDKGGWLDHTNDQLHFAAD